jgi:hypothetical protein
VSDKFGDLFRVLATLALTTMSSSVVLGLAVAPGAIG